MASVAQTVANRSNAQKSTGPRTPEGKAIVAQNAVKHGLLAQRAVVKGEDPQEFTLCRERMLVDLDPVGSVEAILAERIVNLAWRLRRAERLEGAAFDVLEAQRVAKARDQHGASDVADDEETALGRMVVQDFGKHKLLDQLLGYERRIENSLYRSMGELRKERLLRQLGTPDEDAGDVSGKQSQLLAPLSLPAANVTIDASEETPGGVTTNGAEAEDGSCQTNPIRADRLEDQASSEATAEEIGRGCPTYEESSQTRTNAFGTPQTPGGVTTNGAEAQGASCETKPNEVSGVKGQVASQPG
jgi:hypothetical protein